MVHSIYSFIFMISMKNILKHSQKLKKNTSLKLLVQTFLFSFYLPSRPFESFYKFADFLDW